MLTDEKIIEIIQKHYPCFDIEDDAEMLALEREIEAEAVEAERDRWLTTIENEIKSEGPHIPVKVLMGVIDRLREGK